MLQSKEILKKNNGSMSKGHRGPLKGTPTNQIWDNLTMKIDSDSNGL